MPDHAGSPRRRSVRERIEQDRQRRERDRAALEDNVLAADARLDPADQSRSARQTRATAASIRDHREMAAIREVRASADALGVHAPPPADIEVTFDEAGRYVHVHRTAYYKNQAAYLNRLRGQLARGELTAEEAQRQATQARDEAGMTRAAEAQPIAGGGQGGTGASRRAPGADTPVAAEASQAEAAGQPEPTREPEAELAAETAEPEAGL